MEIQTTGGISGPDPIQPNRIPAGRIRPTDKQSPATDRAEISEHARYMALLREVSPMRRERIVELRKLIASGEFETPERIAGAVDKLLDELG